MDDCWNIIGVRGDKSCPELERHAHCHRCPVYANAASQLLDRNPPDDYRTEWTAHFARSRESTDRDTGSVVLFRLGAEWYALSSPVIEEIAHLKPIHSIPHRRTRAVVGITNVRGELLVCVSLGMLLGVQSEAAKPAVQNRGRLLVLRRDDVHVVCPVDEVNRVIRFDRRAVTAVPGTLANAGSRYTRELLSWDDRFVGILDDQLLLYTIRRSLS